MRLKYILDDYGNFALFSEVNTHSTMAQGFYRKPVSAGFCILRGGNPDKGEFYSPVVECYGRSVSLNLESRKEDSKIITNKINGYE